jgi:hypothetical protein
VTLPRDRPAGAHVSGCSLKHRIVRNRGSILTAI